MASSQTEGRRGYYLYAYGTHLWFPQTVGDFSAGVYRDCARDAIPANGVRDAIDMLVHQPGMAFKRGGTTYSGPAMTGVTYAQAVAYATFPGIGGKLVAMGDGTSPHLFTVTSGSTTDVGTMTGFEGMLERPKLFVGGSTNVLVMPGYSGSTTPWYFNGVDAPAVFQGSATAITLTITGTPTGGSFKLSLSFTDPDEFETPAVYRTAAIAYNASAANVVSAINTAISATGVTFAAGGGGSLPGTPVTLTKPSKHWSVAYLPPGVSGVSLTGGTAPTGKITAGSATDVPTGRLCEPHLERMVLANSAENQNRLWFSPELDITSQAWDTSEAWFDMPDTISGLASLSGALMVFSTRGMWRLDGTVPPPETDMSLSPIGHVGCTDARSILVTGSQVIFANPYGVYVTTGIAPVNLMEGKIAAYWRSLFASYDPSTDAGEWCISTGLYADRHLFVTVLNASGAFVDAFHCDLTNASWTRLTNMRHRMYAAAYGIADELYAASRATNRVTSLSGCFTPASGNKNDADGTAVTCTLEGRPFAGGPGVSAFGKGHLTYDMRDAASDNPTLAVSVAAGIEAASFGAAAESPLAETTNAVRARYSTGKRSQALTVKLVQSNASSKTEIYMVEQDLRGFPREAGGQ